ncbi:unnamed protein product [Citrullus colocynthis]|uniref:Uncharacterized protein n=1 Tax=Citrullus colocynthis TaxID=252529 RepID=A0ABP0Y034_9ROSI
MLGSLFRLCVGFLLEDCRATEYTFNVMIRGHLTTWNKSFRALQFYSRMKFLFCVEMMEAGFEPNDMILVMEVGFELDEMMETEFMADFSVLGACGELGDLRLGT